MPKRRSSMTRRRSNRKTRRQTRSRTTVRRSRSRTTVRRTRSRVRGGNPTIGRHRSIQMGKPFTPQQQPSSAPPEPPQQSQPPSFREIFEQGQQFPWKMNLDLVDKRRQIVRQKTQGEDPTNYITNYQTILDKIENAKQNKDKETQIRMNKVLSKTIDKLTQDLKTIVDKEHLQGLFPSNSLLIKQIVKKLPRRSEQAKAEQDALNRGKHIVNGLKRGGLFF